MSSLPDARRTSTPWATAALLILPCAAICLASAAQAPLTLVSTAWSPFTNAPGQPRFALDLVETAFGRIGLTAKTTIVPAAQFTSSLLASGFDGSAAAWKDPDRELSSCFRSLISRTGSCSSDGTATTCRRRR